MDVFTHGILGAVVALAATKGQAKPQAALCGAMGALLPDADVFITSATDPLLVLEYHRQFSHSLLIAPVGALLGLLFLALLFRLPFFNRQLPWRMVYLLTFAGYVSAILLDACTSYGTALFWPFHQPIALAIIAVVDPVFTMALLAALVGSLYRQHSGAAQVGLAAAGLYLLLGQLQQFRAEDAALHLAHSRGLQPEQLIVKPTMGNIVLWRALTITDGEIWADAIRVGPMSKPKTYAGEQSELLHPGDWEFLPPDSRARRDLERFYQLTGELLVRHPQDHNMVGDARYAMLPTSTSPLWGIIIDPDQPNQVTKLVTRREFSPAMRQQFIQMLRGADVPHATLSAGAAAE